MELVVWTGSNALTGFQRAVVSATARPLRARLVFKSRFPHARTHPQCSMFVQGPPNSVCHNFNGTFAVNLLARPVGHVR